MTGSTLDGRTIWRARRSFRHSHDGGYGHLKAPVKAPKDLYRRRSCYKTICSLTLTSMSSSSEAENQTRPRAPRAINRCRNREPKKTGECVDGEADGSSAILISDSVHVGLRHTAATHICASIDEGDRRGAVLPSMPACLRLLSS